MGRHVAPADDALVGAWSRRRGPAHKRAVNRPHLARNGTVLILATMLVTLGIVMVNVVDPYSGAVASPLFQFDKSKWMGEVQKLRASASSVESTARDGLGTVARTTVMASVPAAGSPDPGTAQAIGLEMVLARGWSTGEFDCLVLLWNRESHWNVFAYNASSGAYGIPQSLPGEKMATVGSDWQTNPVTQITWGLNYIGGRYGSPCGAWAHSEEFNWY